MTYDEQADIHRLQLELAVKQSRLSELERHASQLANRIDARRAMITRKSEQIRKFQRSIHQGSRSEYESTPIVDLNGQFQELCTTLESLKRLKQTWLALLNAWYDFDQGHSITETTGNIVESLLGEQKKNSSFSDLEDTMANELKMLMESGINYNPNSGKMISLTSSSIEE